MKIIAHRGVSSLAPENTLAAFKKTAELGFNWFEIDVQLTADKVPVVFHDKKLNRCTNGNGLISEIELHALRSLDAGSWFHPDFSDQKIPTLYETLLLAKTLNLNINIELKLYPEDDPFELCQQVSQVIEYSNIPLSSLIISSFNFDAIAAMQQLQPMIRRGLLWGKIPNNALSFMASLEAYSVHCNYKYLNEKTAKRIKQNNYKLFCFTVNDPDKMNELKRWGVDKIFSDLPKTLMAIT